MTKTRFTRLFAGPLFLTVAGILLVACAPAASGGGATVRGECSEDYDCAGGYCIDGACTSEATDSGGSLGATCDDCYAPNVCRDGICLTPDTNGDACEFDPDCPPDFLCVASLCTPDPRIPRECEVDRDCAGDFSCTMAGVCGCAEDPDCPIGRVCEAGACVGEGCVADDECPMGAFCDRGSCRPEAECDVVHPDLSTAPSWNVLSVYEFREALPGWLDGLLDAVAGPFRILSGEGGRPDLGLPAFIEREIGDAINRWAERNLPPYVRTAMGAIAELNEILSTWQVRETMELTARVDADSYMGTTRWDEVAFEYRGEWMVGGPESIREWTFTPEPYNADATCGTLNIHRHEVDVGIGAIIAWIFDAIVYEASDGRYRDLEDMLRSFEDPLCAEAEMIAERIHGGIGTTARRWCSATVNALITRMLAAIDEALLELDVIKLKGYASIFDGNSLEPGVWQGSLLGGDFPGEWAGSR